MFRWPHYPAGYPDEITEWLSKRAGTVMRTLTVAGALFVASACNEPPTQGPPARLVAGTSDTVVTNSRTPVQIPVRVLDASGKVLPLTGVRYQWASGAPVSVSATTE